MKPKRVNKKDLRIIDRKLSELIERAYDEDVDISTHWIYDGLIDIAAIMSTLLDGE